jgi:hypothetical protein
MVLVDYTAAIDGDKKEFGHLVLEWQLMDR